MIPRIPAALPAAIALACALALPARAEEATSAMVESLSKPVAGLAEMDYLAPGRTVALPPDGVLVLDYLASCTRETITGGTVHVGPQESTVEHGRLTRRRMECDGNDLQLAARQSDVGGVAVYRGLGHEHEKPSLTLRGTMPIILARGSGPILIERLDESEPVRDLTARAAGGRAVVDMASTQTELTAGGVYRVSQGKRSVVVKIADDAAPGALPLMQRMLPL
jgi:hypothetical protein